MFDRLVNAGSWDHMQLVKYLASVRSTLSANEMKRLRATPIFPKEDFTMDRSVPPKTEEATDQSTAAPTPPIKRYPANTLYVPTDAHIALRLPVIEWKASITTPMGVTVTGTLIPFGVALTRLLFISLNYRAVGKRRLRRQISYMNWDL